MPGQTTNLIGWVAVLLFTAGVLLERYDNRVARSLTTAGWAVFALFWLWLFPYFAFVHQSYIEGFLTLAAVPGCLYVGWLLWQGRESLFVLTRSVAVMGLLYLPFETIPAMTIGGVHVPAPARVFTETVAGQTAFLIHLLGYHPQRIVGPVSGYYSAFLFTTPSGYHLTSELVLACTGIGSMVIFTGLITAVRAQLRRKLRALAIAIPIIYALNLARTTFIAVVFGNQYLQVFVKQVMFLFGSNDPYRVSFLLADRVISQSLAVIALVGVTYLVVREVPELLNVIEDMLYVTTRREYDLQEALGVRAPRTDGGHEGHEK